MPRISWPADGPVLVVGFGDYGRALAESLQLRGWRVAVTDDRPEARERASAAGFDVVAPDVGALRVASVCPSPGVPPHHPVVVAAAGAGLPVVSELDLVADWTTTPMVVVTGTDGKTTVTHLVAEMLGRSRRVSLCGNNELPLVTAVDRGGVDTFVVEASSFRLHGIDRLRPAVATWLNLAPDHLEWHGTFDHYRAAKARLFQLLDADAVAIGNRDDPAVMEELRRANSRRVTFGRRGDYHVEGVNLTGPDGPLVAVQDLPRRLPHDLANALAAAATAIEAGAEAGHVADVLRGFRGLPHRVASVGEAGGVRFVNDSKSTTPNATAAAVAGFDSVVLIAGGRNKGLDLSVLGRLVPPVKAVVAIGDAADEVSAAFEGRVPVQVATDMDDAVRAAAGAADAGDTVLLSPACASFDWYGGYAERGDDFVRAVATLSEVQG